MIKNAFPCSQLISRNKSSQITHKALNCAARNSERGTNFNIKTRSILTLKDHFVPLFFLIYKGTFPCYQKEHIFRNNSSQMTHKGLNCSARNSERGRNGSTLTLKDHFVPLLLLFFFFFIKNTFPCSQKEHIFRNNSSQIAHKGLNCSARNSERGRNGSTLTLKDHFVPLLLLSFFFIKNTFPCSQNEHIFRNNSSQIAHKGLNCSARNSERRRNGSTLTLKDHFVPLLLLSFFFLLKTR